MKTKGYWFSVPVCLMLWFVFAFLARSGFVSVGGEEIVMAVFVSLVMPFLVKAVPVRFAAAIAVSIAVEYLLLSRISGMRSDIRVMPLFILSSYIACRSFIRVPPALPEPSAARAGFRDRLAASLHELEPGLCCLNNGVPAAGLPAGDIAAVDNSGTIVLIFFEPGEYGHVIFKALDTFQSLLERDGAGPVYKMFGLAPEHTVRGIVLERGPLARVKRFAAFASLASMKLYRYVYTPQKEKAFCFEEIAQAQSHMPAKAVKNRIRRVLPGTEPPSVEVSREELTCLLSPDDPGGCGIAARA